MKKFSLILVLLTVCLSFTFGQTLSDSITMKKTFGGYQYYHGEKRLNMSQLVKTMEPNEQAYKEIKAAQSTNTIATIIGGAGGFMAG